MNIYLAADFGRADDTNEVAQLLEQSAHVRVVSRWHKRPSAAESAAASRVGGPAERVAREAAERNLEDIAACDVFIVLTTGMPARGGRHFETGYGSCRASRSWLLGLSSTPFSISPIWW